ncbi:MAG: UDP-N-acetylmuramoyl-tripeptide--D-alanyl-D-alanine ligase [Prolixibacteraceae bacterium]
MDIQNLYQLFQEHPVISTDSRDIPSGCIFFALKGGNFDGNRFAAESLEKGASYAVVDDPAAAKRPEFILVNDVLETLQNLARYHRRKLNIPVLAITGTNGKTTTKELVSAVLRRKYMITSTQGNLNNHIGVPVTLLGMTSQTELAVIEMGANHPGEIAALCQIAEPDFGIITNIGKAHLEGFGSFEGVIKTKSELYDFLRQKHGRCFINTDNELLVTQAAGLDLLTYGTNDEAQLQGFPEQSSWYLTIRVLFPKGWLYLKSKLIGSYNFENILAAARIGLHFGVEPTAIQKAIENYVPENNRSQLIQTGSNRIIMDAYNANPTSMTAALNNFAKISYEKKTVILGDMLELGSLAEEEHQKIADLIELQHFDAVYLVGHYFSAVDAGTAMKFDKTEHLSAHLDTQKPIAENLILIKGSRGIGLEKIIDKLGRG